MSVLTEKELYSAYLKGYYSLGGPRKGTLQQRETLGAVAVHDAVLDALIAEAEPIDACEDIEVCGWHSVSGWLRSLKGTQP